MAENSTVQRLERENSDLNSELIQLKKQIADVDKNERYKSALSIWHYEGRIAWNVFIGFLAVQAIVFKFSADTYSHILTLASGNQLANELLFLGSLTFGVLSSNILYIMQRRASKYNILRIAQVHANEPSTWDLIRGVGKSFSLGHEVKVQNPFSMQDDTGKGIQFTCASRIRMKYLIALLMGLFIAAYLFLLFLFLSNKFAWI